MTSIKKINTYFYLVSIDGADVGFIRKAPASKSIKTPAQPFTINECGQVGEMITDHVGEPLAFWGKNAKAEALDAIVKHITK